MNIYIPSRGRSGNLLTPSTMSLEARRNTTIVVPPDEEVAYQLSNMPWVDQGMKIVCPDIKPGVPHARQWIVENCPSTCAIMLDDDMKFGQRSEHWDKDYHFYRPMFEAGEQTDRIWKWLVDSVETDGYILAGISARQGNQNIPDRYSRLATRQNNIHAVHCIAAKNLGLRWDAVEGMEDFDFTLQCFRAGYPNILSVEYIWNQRGSGKEGGCATYRTPLFQAKTAKALETKWPKFVTTVNRASQWPGMPSRTDVRIQWRKAAKKYVIDLGNPWTWKS